MSGLQNTEQVHDAWVRSHAFEDLDLAQEASRYEVMIKYIWKSFDRDISVLISRAGYSRVTS